MRKIDIFTHIYPVAFYDKLMQVAPNFKDVGKRSRGVPMLVDLDERFRVMDRFEGYEQVLSLPTPPLWGRSSGIPSRGRTTHPSLIFTGAGPRTNCRRCASHRAALPFTGT